MESEEKDLQFQDWTYKFALLPNVERKADLRKNLEDFKEPGIIYVITKEENIADAFKLEEQEETMKPESKEYILLARAIITSLHVGRAQNINGPIEPQILIEPIEATSMQKTSDKLAGKGAAPIGPGFNPDNLDKLDIENEVTYAKAKAKTSKDPANSLEIWILWHPEQATTIRNITFPKLKENEQRMRYLIQGAYGTGKTQILISLAMKAVNQKKRVCFWSMITPRNSTTYNFLFDSYIQNICKIWGINFFSGRENIKERMKKIRLAQYDVLLVDEVKVSKDPGYFNDQASDEILR